MLGPAKSRRLDEPIAVSLEALVPQGHFYRHLESKLDLGFVRGWVDDHYADRCRPSIDPVDFFKLREEPGTEMRHAPNMSSRGTAIAVARGCSSVGHWRTLGDEIPRCGSE